MNYHDWQLRYIKDGFSPVQTTPSLTSNIKTFCGIIILKDCPRGLAYDKASLRLPNGSWSGFTTTMDANSMIGAWWNVADSPLMQCTCNFCTIASYI
ncbi:hypothetical protein TcWFU_001251 [Taenia crassiceps]|uniref:Uncharacterized protein n=1 Tax=Taenia crassiceps TaxID=6207 RepID=A0ABR4QA95_9CEST